CTTVYPTPSYASLTPRCALRSLFFYGAAAHRDLPSFPTRRSSDLELRALATSVSTAWRLRFRRGPRRRLPRHRWLRAYRAEDDRSEEHTSELQSRRELVCRLLLEKKKTSTAGCG